MSSDRVVRIRVEVAYATPTCQTLLELEVPAGVTVGEAIGLSGIEAAHPEIDISGAQVGIFGKVASRDVVLEEGDRVEIYRPLIADPKETRRRRVGSGGRRRKT
jgi:putative ubiquitin-RnfH superfamily antitoxin RatB of RatAB toxin-antitoxin module